MRRRITVVIGRNWRWVTVLGTLRVAGGAILAIYDEDHWTAWTLALPDAPRRPVLLQE